ncbi:hypothetical protein R6Q57_024647 [Mikania cordata]
MGSLNCANFTLLTGVAIILQIAGLSLFVFGFFPIKPALSGFSGAESFRPPSCEDQNHTALHPDQLKSLYLKFSEIPPSYDRLILMVIDGLPAEFVLGRDDQPPSKILKDAMPYTQSLLSNKMALSYHARAAPPTVTLPRLKAMTTGSIGGFLDVLFNFNSQALLEDNILDQFFRIGWKMVMLGDETWLKLFPGLFARHDGVSSFFVKDTVEVDHNVSRHLSYELYKKDWNLLVDITPTLALLFGVPIPKNNAGYLIADLFHLVEDHQLLRAMELNSWQLLRLLQAQKTDSSCGSLKDASSSLYLDATVLHESWKSKNVLRSASIDDLNNTVMAYNEFLRTASHQLSHRATDKPIGLIASGVMTMLLSCVVFLGLLFKLGQEIYPNLQIHKHQLSEVLVGGTIIIIVLSMGSSSLVEEEQYLWHFMTSTFFLVFLHNTIKSTTGNLTSQLFLIAVVLISGRILKGWHQGGVNWTHLPDISKSLETSGSPYIKLLQIISIFLVISLCLYTLYSLCSRDIFVSLIGISYLCNGLLVLWYVIKYQGDGAGTSGNDAVLAVQLIYGLIITSVTVTVIVSPWFMSFQSKDLVLVIKGSLCLSGTTYMFCWCLLQLLLQQPVNSMAISLLLLQINATIYYASYGGSDVKQWVEIAAIYYLGMAGHFSLGNTNTLATIDVAGAFIGIISHSIMLSGVIMFVITYASPMLALLSLMMSMSVKEIDTLLKIHEVNTGQILKIILGFPCLVPLGLNSVLLVAYTFILLIMRNHLFIWTVFSPK